MVSKRRLKVYKMESVHIIVVIALLVVLPAGALLATRTYTLVILKMYLPQVPCFVMILAELRYVFLQKYNIICI